MTNWNVRIGGGIGDEVWDNEFTVTGDDIWDALLNAERHMMEIDPFDGKVVRGSGEIFSIEQEE